jgi:hypothetical protein
MKKIMLSLVVLMFVVSGMMKAQTNTKMITYYDPEEKIAYYVVWDTKTGNNLQYYWAGDKWDTMAFNIPSPPLLDTIKGDIMFDVYYDTKVKRAFYTIWDTKTGKNIQYLWDEGQWSEMKYNLPQQPFEGAKGDIMMTSYYSESEGKAFYVFYDAAGGKSVQYFWADDHWTDMRLNLPEKPLAKWRP